MKNQHKQPTMQRGKVERQTDIQKYWQNIGKKTINGQKKSKQA